MGHDRDRFQCRQRSSERLGSVDKVDSWEIVFDADGAIAKFKDCGVDILDSADDVLAAALHHLELDPNTKNERNEIELAPPRSSPKRDRSVRKFHSSEYLNALAGGEICLALGWSGDIKQAQKRAAEAKAGIEVGYAIPKEGAQMFFDNLAIPKDARNVGGGAHLHRLS